MKEHSQKLFDALPEGEKVTGGNLKEELSLTLTEWKEAKTELRDLDLIILGRGRGGSITRIEGVEPPPEAPKMSQGEKVALAAEEKRAKSKEQKQINEIKDKARVFAAENLNLPESAILPFPRPTRKDVIIEAWEDGAAKIYSLPYSALGDYY